MKTVGVRELKNRLSEYLREARRGEHLPVTDRGVGGGSFDATAGSLKNPVTDRWLYACERSG